jgi:hypothetical protein
MSGGGRTDRIAACSEADAFVTALEQDLVDANEFAR